MKNIFILLLGCNIQSILFDRVLTTINFIEKNKLNFNKITWYLSGGIKFDGELSEASIMKSILIDIIIKRYLNHSIIYSYILDEDSKNTAENFYRASKYLNSSNEKYDEMYISTSKFHHNRAKLIQSFIDTTHKYKWILGDLQLDDSMYWERIHIKNVKNDIIKLSHLDL
jgi:hypothetical protein